jgi:hypothetical protein
MWKGRFKIQRTSNTQWESHNMNAGFTVQLVVFKSTQSAPSDIVVENNQIEMQNASTFIGRKVFNHSDLGITETFEPSPALDLIFAHNEALVNDRLAELEETLKSYRDHYLGQYQWKQETMSYAFLVHIYNNHNLPQSSLVPQLIACEQNVALHRLSINHQATLACLYDRIRITNLSPLHKVWYVFWDEFYRQNWRECRPIQRHTSDFSPVFTTSICYHPKTRIRLEKWLTERRLFHSGKKGKSGYIHHGLLNRLYCLLELVAFGDQAPQGARVRMHVYEREERYSSLRLQQSGYPTDVYY